VGSPRLAPYDPEWPLRYEAEARRLREALGNVIAMEHVGSTSVPGLSGKPTIDIAAAVPTLTLPDLAKRQMEALGYSYGGDLGLPQHVFCKGAGVPREFIVHVVERDGQSGATSSGSATICAKTRTRQNDLVPVFWSRSMRIGRGGKGIVGCRGRMRRSFVGGWLSWFGRAARWRW
jgi:GrpB protein